MRYLIVVFALSAVLLLSSCHQGSAQYRKEAAAEERARAATVQAMSDLPKGPPPPMPNNGAQLDKEPNWASAPAAARHAARHQP